MPTVDSQPTIENPGRIKLPREAPDLLWLMFAGYERVVVRGELSGGYSGCRVFVMRPVRPDGVELPAVIKMGPRPLIEQEWRAYNHCIDNRLPGVAEIRGEPVYLSDWGALRYPLVGSGEFQVTSLRQYGLNATAEELVYVLKERLFKSMRATWRYHEIAADFSLRDSYDHLLPVNLLIECVALAAGATMLPLTPATALNNDYEAGTLVVVSGFEVVEIDVRQRTLTLNLPYASGNGRPASYRLRLLGLDEPGAYRVGQVVERPLTGIIQATRRDQFHEQLQRALGPEFDLRGDTVLLPDGQALPNPLLALARALRETRDVRLACIHGDLNLENVLVEYDYRSATVHLIDFASARQDHVLHDLLRLETGLLLHLFPEALGGVPVEQLVAFYRRLHCATVESGPIVPPAGLERPFAVLLFVRRMAHDFLFDSEAWSEYYQGLTLYLLGALKYRDLDSAPEAPSSPKQLAFWAAAAVQQLLEEPAPCREVGDMKAIPVKSTFLSFDAVQNLSDRFFHWSQAPEHLRSSWAGKATWALSAVTGRMTPQGWFAASLSLALWIVTAWAVTPFYQWPLAEAGARFLACVQFAVAAVLTPLAIAAATRPDYDTLIIRETWRQRLTLLLLKMAGALVGFGAFAGALLFVAMGVYYVTLESLPVAVWWLLTAVPLLFSHIAARRIPADRYKMYGHKPQMHPADKLFLVAFLLFGPLLATFVFLWYSLLSQRWMGIVLLLVIAFIAWRESRRNP